MLPPAIPPAESLEGGFDPEPLILTLMATGQTRWDAALTVLAAGAEPATIPFLRGVPAECLCSFERVDDALPAFQRVAEADPVGANAALNAFLAGRGLVGIEVRWLELAMNWPWVTILPDGLRVDRPLEIRAPRLAAWPDRFQADGGLRLRGGVTAILGRGLTVGGHLILEGVPFRALPAGLRVGGDLVLRQCPFWDGRVPEDAQVGGLVVTNAYRNGLSLADWRRRNPYGEAGRLGF
jgi:hypothetical protein